jgi:hypothetical protein
MWKPIPLVEAEEGLRVTGSRPVAFVSIHIRDIVARLGGTLERDRDDLDEYSVACYQMELGTILLIERDNSPVQGVEVIGSPELPEDRILSSMREWIGIDDALFTWIPDE